jgi:general secretion pathway protein D
LKDGEVSLLGGLMSDQEQNIVGGIPGLANIPVLRYLFGNVSKDKQKEELMIALIPHIVRRPDITGLDLQGVAAGTDQTVKLTFAPRVEEAPAVVPVAVPPAGAPPATSPVATPPPGTPLVVTPGAPGGAAGILFNPAKVQAQLSNQVVLTLQAQNLADVASVPVKLRWDPKVLRLEMITPGALLTQDGKITAPSLDIRNDTGDASIDVNRVAGAGGVNGNGPLLQFTFTAVGKGITNVTITEAAVKNSKQEPIALQAPVVAVTVQ